MSQLSSCRFDPSSPASLNNPPPHHHSSSIPATVDDGKGEVREKLSLSFTTRELFWEQTKSTWQQKRNLELCVAIPLFLSKSRCCHFCWVLFFFPLFFLPSFSAAHRSILIIEDPVDGRRMVVVVASIVPPEEEHANVVTTRHHH